MFTSGCRKTPSKPVRAAVTAVLCVLLLLQLRFSSSLSAAAPAASSLRVPPGVNHEKLITDASFQPEVPDELPYSPLTRTKASVRSRRIELINCTKVISGAELVTTNAEAYESRMAPKYCLLHRKIISCLQLPVISAVQLRTTTATLHSLDWQRLLLQMVQAQNLALPGYSFMKKAVRDLLLQFMVQDGARRTLHKTVIKSRSRQLQPQHRKTRKLFMTYSTNMATAVIRATRIPAPVHDDLSAAASIDDTHLDYSDPRTHPPRGN